MMEEQAQEALLAGASFLLCGHPVGALTLWGLSSSWSLAVGKCRGGLGGCRLWDSLAHTGDGRRGDPGAGRALPASSVLDLIGGGFDSWSPGASRGAEDPGKGPVFSHLICPESPAVRSSHSL